MSLVTICYQATDFRKIIRTFLLRVHNEDTQKTTNDNNEELYGGGVVFS
jgi:hypothetical protein